MISKELQVNNLMELEVFSKELSLISQPNLFLILQGNLGTGKTTLTQLIAKNLGIVEKVTSPTFNILQRYPIKEDYFLNHFDLFRIKKEEDLFFLDDLTTDNLNIIEWGENNPQFWQNKKNIIIIQIIKETDSEERKIKMIQPD